MTTTVDEVGRVLDAFRISRGSGGFHAATVSPLD